MSIRSGLLASMIASLFLTVPAAAGAGDLSSPHGFNPDSTQTVIAPESPHLLMHLQQEEIKLLRSRAALPKYFAEAYQQYPQIPAGVLEAVAYSQTRWMQVQADPDNDAHHRMPTAHGVMGLYAGEGFTDQVSAASALTGMPVSLIVSDSRANILAAAALLAREIDALETSKAGATPLPEQISMALERYAGFAPMRTKKNVIDDFARQSFAFDVLLALDRGVNEKGMMVPERAIQWEAAFAPDTLVKLRAPFVRVDISKGSIDAGDYTIDPVSETLVDRSIGAGVMAKSTDYGPAIWSAASSSNYTASRSQAVSAVAIHTAQGSYAGTISWFKNPAAKASAHYVIRSSDGQVTQMVRNAHMAWHVRSQNPYTLGIEHEGYVNNSAWYTTAMYNASAALVRNFCAKYGTIPCSSAYKGPASNSVNVLPTSVKIKGHQHYTGNTHTDPGINWNWSRYYDLLNPGSGGPTGKTTVLDSFESSVGHFNTSPAYSGSTTGISSSSTATRDCSMRKSGNCSLQVKLVDNPSSSAKWEVRLLSGSGTPSQNVKLTRAYGKVGFWVYSGGTGLSAALGVDDSDGTERSITRSIPANTWTYLEWSLTDANHWNAWVGGNGKITASTVTLDAVWLFRDQTSYNVYVYIDNVQIKN